MMEKFLAVAALACASTVSLAGDGEWTSTGPEGGQPTTIVNTPTNGARFYLSTSSGLFRSDDSGLNWLRLGANLPISGIRTMVASPTNAAVLYVASFGVIYKTANSGVTWTALNSGFPTATNFTIYDLAIAPGSPDTLYVSTFNSGLYKSSDAGASFTRIGTATLPDQLGSIAVDPLNPLRLAVSPCPDGNTPYLGAAMYRSADAGASFVAATVTGAPSGSAACAATLDFSASQSGLVLGRGSTNQVLRSTDAGAVYSLITPTPPGQPTVNVSQFLFLNASTVWVANSFGGLQQSTDAGLTYSAVASSPSLPGSSVPLESFTLATLAGNTAVRLIGTGDGVYRSTDSGTTWSRQSSGLRGANIRSLAVNPSATINTIWAGTSDLVGQQNPLFRSPNAGVSWNTTGAVADLDSIRTLLLDTNTSSGPNPVLYAGGRDSSPARALTQRFSSVAKSTDGGTTWTSLQNFAGLTPTGPGSIATAVANLGTVRAIVPDRSVVTAGAWSKLYLSSSGVANCTALGGAISFTVPRLWRTLDAGANWNTISTPGTGTSGAVGTDGLPLGECIQPPDLSGFFVEYATPVPIVVDPVDPNTLYVGTFLRFSGAYNPTTPNGVFRSTDGGVTWTLRSNGLPRYTGSIDSAYGVLALVMDPNNRNILYAAANANDNGSVPGNVYKSIDAGANWTVAGVGLAGQDIRALLIDPTNSLRIFAASGGSALNPGAVFVSENGGALWKSISAGLPTGSATSLALKGSTLYAGTRFGVAEFTRVPDGDDDGSPTAAENGATVSGDGNGDGIADANQSNVAAGSSPSTRAPLGRTNYIVESSPSLRNGSTCTQLYDTIYVDADGFGLDPNHPNKPLGALRFEVADCVSTRIVLRYPDVARLPKNAIIRSFGPATQGDANSFRWNTIPSTLSADQRSISFVINDNQLGDARADSNRILFQGGLALDLFANGFED
jgi:photosystem II stability/assembly factor-like uncharacterized protein